MTLEEINSAKSRLNNAAKQFYSQSKVNAQFNQGTLVQDLGSALQVLNAESDLSNEIFREQKKFGKLAVVGYVVGGITLLFTLGSPLLMIVPLAVLGGAVFCSKKKKSAVKKKKELSKIGLVDPCLSNFIVPIIQLFRDDYDPNKKAEVQYDTNYVDQQKYKVESNKYHQKHLGFKFTFRDKSVLELDHQYFLKSKYKKRKGTITNWKEVLVLKYTKKGEGIVAPKEVVGDFVIVPGEGKFTVKTKVVRRADKKLRPDELLAQALKLIGQLSQTLKTA